MLDAHAGHGAHRAAPQAHGAARPVVAEMGRGRHRAVISGHAGKSTPGPTRRALLPPHPEPEGGPGLEAGGLLDSVRQKKRGGGRSREPKQAVTLPPLAPVCLSARLGPPALLVNPRVSRRARQL